MWTFHASILYPLSNALYKGGVSGTGDSVEDKVEPGGGY